MKKLNFGCGNRIAPGWTNIDFDPIDARVSRVNLLAGFPFEDNTFDVVYSSHALEHFTRAQARFLIGESHRILRPGGTLRIVVPDLADVCREYLRVLALADGDARKPGHYAWVTVELLDQMVRTVPGGDMGALYKRLSTGGNPELAAYVNSRTENAPPVPGVQQPLSSKIARLTPARILTKLYYIYIDVVSRLIPANTRNMVFVQTGIGERHRWMYDAYGLRMLLREVGFWDARELAFDQSSIPSFHADCLDSNADGSRYKNASLYMEATKPQPEAAGLGCRAPDRSVAA